MGYFEINAIKDFVINDILFENICVKPFKYFSLILLYQSL